LSPPATECLTGPPLPVRPDPRLDRRLVSFQADRDRPFFSWFKYKEAFSADLVRLLLEEYGPPGGRLLDPFAGVGTTPLVASALGWDAVGIELLPVGCFVATCRRAALHIDPAEFRRCLRPLENDPWPDTIDQAAPYPHLTITQGAFPPAAEQAIASYRAYCARRVPDPGLRDLYHLAALSVLEDVSYTRKDGQYLRWDERSRRTKGRRAFRKPRVEDFRSAVLAKLRRMLDDLESTPFPENELFPQRKTSSRPGALDLIQGSCLDLLPQFPARSVGLVLTSPPYCNRYDYTRTYALELAYLGCSDTDVKQLRQAMLSCTVENRAKRDALNGFYSRLGRAADYRRALRAADAHSALRESLAFLRAEASAGRLNNPHIPRMVENYFVEITVVLMELARLLTPGGRAIMVNDNVRYAGREIAVDLILSDIASTLGFEVETISALPRGKGNSSQQMGRHGRAELRKSICIWRRP